jgi:hypothetical protein
VYFDGEHLFVSDSGNHRVLFWKVAPHANDVPPDYVIGQPDDAHCSANQGLPAPTASSLFQPGGMLRVDDRVYVADSGNNRVVVYGLADLRDGVSSRFVLGQPDAVSRTPSAIPSDTTRLAGPTRLASDGVQLFVVERDLARVTAFGLDADRTARGTMHAAIGFPFGAPGAIAVTRAPNFRTTMFVADSRGDRIVVVEGVTRLADDSNSL